jgi:hypothetical protein
MLRSTAFLRLVVLMAALASVALMLGSEPWGPY